MIATLKWSLDAALFLLENVTLDRITDHRWLDQTVQKLIAFRSRKFIACPSNPSVLNNASVLWCAKKSRMRVLMDSCHRNIWIEFLFRRDFTEGSHSRLALLPLHTNFAFVVYIFVNFFLQVTSYSYFSGLSLSRRWVSGAAFGRDQVMRGFLPDRQHAR